MLGVCGGCVWGCVKRAGVYESGMYVGCEGVCGCVKQKMIMVFFI